MNGELLSRSGEIGRAENTLNDAGFRFGFGFGFGFEVELSRVTLSLELALTLARDRRCKASRSRCCAATVIAPHVEANLAAGVD
jgi:hypothetical protein